MGLAGIALGALIIWRLGPDRVWNQFSAGSWKAFLWVLALYLLQQILGTLALWLLGTRERRGGWRVTPFWRLARVRYVGEVLNFALPTGGIGGEPYKHIVLSRSEGTRPSFHALAAAKFLHVAGIGPFGAVIFFGGVLSGYGGNTGKVILLSLGFLSIFISLLLRSYASTVFETPGFDCKIVPLRPR